jgi:hypothetical protein
MLTEWDFAAEGEHRNSGIEPRGRARCLVRVGASYPIVDGNERRMFVVTSNAEFREPEGQLHVAFVFPKDFAHLAIVCLAL